MDYKLELIVMPVADMDHRGGGDFRVIQLTPPGSACSISLMRNPERAGTLQGLHLVVQDIEAARADLASRNIEISEPFHFGPEGQRPGLDPDRRNHGSFASFNDPDGNGWMVQEVKR